MTEIKLITCVGVEHDLALLPHFLQYYQGLGISAGNIHAVLHASEDNTAEMDKAVALLSDYGIRPQERWIAPYTSKSMWDKRREIQKKVAKADDWIISADVDEFHEFPVDLKEFLVYCDKKKLNCIQGVFVDRLAHDGKLTPVAPDTPIWEQYPIQADVMCTIRQYEQGNWAAGTVNVMACKGSVLPSLGGHSALAGETPVNYLFGRHLGKLPGIGRAQVRFAVPLRVHHFKWTDRLTASLKKRLSTPGVSERGKMYGEALLNHIDGPGRILVEKMPVRTPGFFERLPWKYQLNAFSQRLLRIRISNKLKKIVSKQ
ncbi:glycosyltransferase family 2 protein [Salinimonas marina]|uniref:Glycosyltransferase family 2 protein n=1 Tax=Salinimonas marina TaxID=2785918 RepID=A0A7S9DYZ5_9ALTE|nr:glycosyltransferase family 2 protein [Salinimonas marina]QPG06407.1 glycosyltransferase family 2 protein [Salinimonas marina]